MRTDQSRLRRPGIAAATAALLVAGIVGTVGVAGAGAGEDKTIFAVENGLSPCFSNSATGPCDGTAPEVRINTGDTVTWKLSSGIHNAASNGSTPAVEEWDTRTSPLVSGGPDQKWTFGEAGTYRFICEAHKSTMVGTIVVEGEQVETPEPDPVETPVDPVEDGSASPTFVATFPPGATATPDNHLNTPAPGKGKAAKDTAAPRVLRARVKSASGGAKLSFWVSEPANIEVTVRRGKSVVTSARLHVAAGTRTVALRSSSLRRKGTYKVQWYAVDAMANKGNVVKKTLKVKG